MKFIFLAGFLHQLDFFVVVAISGISGLVKLRSLWAF